MVWRIVVSVRVIGFGVAKSICISSGAGALALSSDTVIYIEEGAEKGGTLDSEEQEDDVEEEDEVDVSVVAEIVDSGSEISRCCRRSSSILSSLVLIGCSTGSCAGGDCQYQFAFGYFVDLLVVYWLMLMRRMRMKRIVLYCQVVVSFVDRRRH